MGRMERLVIEDLGGQNCRVVITKRSKDSLLPGSKTVRFESTEGYPYPSFEESELENLLERVKAF